MKDGKEWHRQQREPQEDDVELNNEHHNQRNLNGAEATVVSVSDTKRYSHAELMPNLRECENS